MHVVDQDVRLCEVPTPGMAKEVQVLTTGSIAGILPALVPVVLITERTLVRHRHHRKPRAPTLHINPHPAHQRVDDLPGHILVEAAVTSPVRQLAVRSPPPSPRPGEERAGREGVPSTIGIDRHAREGDVIADRDPEGFPLRVGVVAPGIGKVVGGADDENDPPQLGQPFDVLLKVEIILTDAKARHPEVLDLKLERIDQGLQASGGGFIIRYRETPRHRVPDDRHGRNTRPNLRRTVTQGVVGEPAPHRVVTRRARHPTELGVELGAVTL